MGFKNLLIMEKLNTIKQIKSQIKEALIEKGQTPGDKFNEYPNLIRNIETGGIDESSLFKDEYVSSFFFYRIREKETVSDIATKFKVNKDTLLAANPKKSFLPNELILIPR